ncbi:MAG: hypothetical protein WD009_09750 [Phycisphaeraceae bacterium]
MPELEHHALRLVVSDDGLHVEIEDKARGVHWRLDAASRWFMRDGADADRAPLPAGEARRAWRGGEASVVAEHPIDGGAITLTWRLKRDYVAVAMQVQAVGVARVAWPGRFVPTQGAMELLVPSYQGALARRTGEAWHYRCRRGGHINASLGVAALLGERGGLTLMPENLTGWTIDCGESREGLWLGFEDTPCPVAGWGERVMRLQACEASVTAAAACYRRFVQEQGRFTSWAEKIDARPMVANLFGSLIAFTGYVADPALDYVTNVRALKAMGFERLLLFPLRFAHYSQGFTMAGGLPPVWVDDAAIAELRAMAGVHLGPWAWAFEGIDDGSDEMARIFRRDARGGLMPVWSMDGQTWKMVCPAYQAEHMRHWLAGDMAWTDWIHFDVNATHGAEPCWNEAHAGHEGRALGREADIELTRPLLSGATVGDRIISSEGFNDAFTSSYDVGTTKMVPLDEPNPRAMPVPLTMLVFHDCCVHDWWELHGYNTNPGWPMGETITGSPPLGRNGSGEAALKAAQDALYGLPPQVFPFGRQYAWRDVKTRETYPFDIALEDDEVQRALAAALPVTRLHRRIGQLAMTDFEMLSDDRFVQRTTFADGTQVVANLGRREAEVAGVGRIAGRAWHATEP